MRETLKVLSRMARGGVTDAYAIGGAVAAIYYVEPFDTADPDIFVQSKGEGGGLDILAPIYEYLRGLGHEARGEFIYVEGLPVQFLPAYNPLTQEAVERAQEISYSRVRTRVMRAEHLVAIMVQTGRPKDYLRIAMFLEHGAVNARSLRAVLRRHGLERKWGENRYRFGP